MSNATVRRTKNPAPLLSRPILEQERQFAKGLAAGNPGTLNSIANLLAQKDEAARQFVLSDDVKGWLTRLLELARA